MRGKDGEAGSSWLVLVGSAKGPESDGTSAKLGEPALQLGLRRVVGKTAHVEDLAAL